MPKVKKTCPACGQAFVEWQNPIPTIDIIIEIGDGIVLIKRKNPPYGWALPGGFVDVGETVEEAAVREAKEETSLDIRLKRQFHTYSDPERDPRHHTISTVFVAEAHGSPCAADDAAEVGIFTSGALPEPIAFDHGKIVFDYFQSRY
jgi:ADP-ribose pyrophosphatase YjhB (NUDIX family)